MEIDTNRDEIDLYDELLTFSELPPDQQIIKEHIDFSSALEAAEVIEPPSAPDVAEVVEPAAAPPVIEAAAPPKNDSAADEATSFGFMLDDESFRDILEGISPSKLAERASQSVLAKPTAPKPVEKVPTPEETAPVKPVDNIPQASPPKAAPIVEPVEETPAAIPIKEVPADTTQAVSSSKPTEKVSTKSAAEKKPAADKKTGTRITIREDKTDGGITLNAEDLLAEEDELIYTSQKTETPPSAIEVLEKVSGPLKPEMLEKVSGSLESEALEKASRPVEPQKPKKVSGSLKSLPNFPEPTELPPEMSETKPLETASEPSAAKPPSAKSPTQPTGDLLRASAPLKITGFLNEPPPEPENTGGLVAICPVCGHQSDRQAIICIECGYLFNETRAGEDDQKTCLDCGLKTRSDEMFCPDCGAILLG